MVFFQPGRLKIARTPEHEKQVEGEVARGKQLGLDVDLIAPEAAKCLMPFLHIAGIRAVLHMRTDVYLEPVQVPLGYARASARLGARLLPETRVTEIVVEHGAVTRVATDKGEIRATAVVDAAGGWLRRVASLAGASVPVLPTRHQLMITVPLPEVTPDQPITPIIDANAYVRPDNGGPMLSRYAQ